MAREIATIRMIQAYEKDIRDFAKVTNLVKRSLPMRSAWYCALLVHTGKRLITFGTRLIIRYSAQTSLPAR